MKKSRFSEEQIIGILQEQEAGMKMAEVCVPPASACAERTNRLQ